jgi:osmoprotectant transport system substrate-binding protein
MRRSVAAIVIGIVAAASCRGDGASVPVTEDRSITVASFDFAESEVVAEVYAQALRGAGFEVEHVRGVGAREILLPALERGLVEMVPEYTGSALEFLGGAPSPDAAATAASLELLLAQRGIDAMTPASAASRNGLVVSAETARRFRLRTVSDLRGVAPTMSLGGPPECPERAFCLPGFERAYGLSFGSFLPLDVGGPVTAEAVQRGTVDVGVLFTSDASLARRDLVLLRDDQRLQPAENIVPLVRRDTVERFGPRLTHLIDRVSAELTTGDLRELNALVSTGTSIEHAAAAWISRAGFAEPSE